MEIEIGSRSLCWIAFLSTLCLVSLTGVFGEETPSRPTGEKPRLVLLLGRFDDPSKDLAAMTLAWMCREAGVEFDVYYAADHKEGGLFSQHGSTVIGGHHGARIARALAAFRTTVVRLGGVTIFDSLIHRGAEKVADAPESIVDLYAAMVRDLRLKMPAEAVAFERGGIPLPVLYPECVYRRALAVPLTLKAEEIQRLKKAGVNVVWTVAKADADASAWKAAGFEIKVAADLSAPDPGLAAVEKWIGKAAAVDPLEPILASYLLPLSIRENRLILSYNSRQEAEKRRDQMLRLTADKEQTFAYGRWFGDAQLLPLAQRPMAYNVVEPCRQVLTVFSRQPAPLPQPAKSCFDLEPTDQQLRDWLREGKILATWVLHSGELSHDDSVLAFLDWSAMTKVKIGSGVHCQRYHVDPDVVEPMHVPVNEGGVLGLVEPVLHSAGFGIMWETAGDPAAVAAMMKKARRKIAEVAGERSAPRGVYCFGDHHGQGQRNTPGDAQVALWKAVKGAGFDYVITSVLPGDSRILFRDGDFVVLNQAGRHEGASPFVRGYPASFTVVEKELAGAGKPGWLVGAIDTPIHGSPIYVGRPYQGKSPRINDFFDYVQKGGATGKVISATPHTIARYARIVDDAKPRPEPTTGAKP
jgi:hypothetical protein